MGAWVAFGTDIDSLQHKKPLKEAAVASHYSFILAYAFLVSLRFQTVLCHAPMWFWCFYYTECSGQFQMIDWKSFVFVLYACARWEIRIRKRVSYTTSQVRSSCQGFPVYPKTLQWTLCVSFFGTMAICPAFGWVKTAYSSKNLKKAAVAPLYTLHFLIRPNPNAGKSVSRVLLWCVSRVCAGVIL